MISVVKEFKVIHVISSDTTIGNIKQVPTEGVTEESQPYAFENSVNHFVTDADAKTETTQPSRHPTGRCIPCHRDSSNHQH